MASSEVCAIESPMAVLETAARRRRLGLAVLLAGSFMTVLDAMIVQLALPSIARDLHAGSAAIELIVAGLALALWAWPRLGLSQLAEHVSAGLSVALGLYLMLWPTVGFHLAGIDFGYMFQWIPEAEYERYWQLIGLGLVIKLALPLVLVLFVARPALGARPVLVVVSASFCAKVALLALLIAAYAATHDMRSEQALAMLAELSLLLFVVCTSLLALPSAAATLTAAAASTELQGAALRIARWYEPSARQLLRSGPRLGSKPRASHGGREVSSRDGVGGRGRRRVTYKQRA